MNDYIILQNMLELAQQLGNATSKEILVKNISTALNVNSYHNNLQYDILIDTHQFDNLIDPKEFVEL